MNTLANHNIIHHNGRKLDKETVVSALVNLLKQKQQFASFLCDQALALGYEENGVRYFDLHQLQAYYFYLNDFT
jgi:hypothetical protein